MLTCAGCQDNFNPGEIIYQCPEDLGVLCDECGNAPCENCGGQPEPAGKLDVIE